MLFHMERLQYADTVIFTEGEKDADTVTELHLKGQYGEVIGTTSGSATSWEPSLAKHLRGKRVVLMPDADEPGARFAEQVKASLETERIEFRTVTFEDASAKDVTEFLSNHSVEELVRRIGTDWVWMPNGQHLEEINDCVYCRADGEPHGFLDGEITI
jgi:putative DNA primase/helicase